MKVLIAIPCLNRGGTEIQTLSLVKVLCDEGYAVTTICYFEYNEDVVAEYKKTGSEVLLLGLNRNITAFKLITTLKTVFRNLKPDIVHIQYLAPGALPIIAARLARVKSVLATVHQPYTKSHGIKAKMLLRLASALCTKFICVSKNAEISWFGTSAMYNREQHFLKLNTHFTIYNSVDIEKINQLTNNIDVCEIRKKLNIPKEQIIIGAISRFNFEKGIDILIKGFSYSVKKKSNLHLLIVGDGVEDIKLKSLAKSLNISEYITFLGRTNWEEAMQLMYIMQIIVVPSRFEGFGLTAAEALSMGKPVIASDVYGLKEVVDNEINGLLFKCEDYNQLSSLIDSLIENKLMMKEIGDNGYIKAKRNFDFVIYKEYMLSLYNSISRI